VPVNTVRRLAVAIFGFVLLAVLLTGAVLEHQGYRAYVVHTGSMVPTYNPGDLVIDRPVRGTPKPGQVITFRHSADTPDVVTHRVTAVTATGLIHTQGDANRTADAWQLSPAMVRGSVIRGIPRAGFVLIFLKQPAGIGALATSVLSLTLLWSLFFPSPQPAQLSASGARRRAGRHSARQPAAV
jgi:signal peptidase I